MAEKEDEKREGKKKAKVIELDLTQMSGVVNEAVEKLISQGKLVRDEETGEIIDPDDEEKMQETIEKNKALGKYKLESKGKGNHTSEKKEKKKDNKDDSDQ
jgi:hypothetical protein